MLGWNISVYSQEVGGGCAANPKSKVSKQIAVWQTGNGELN
jgi:hypothetical protein